MFLCWLDKKITLNATHVEEWHGPSKGNREAGFVDYQETSPIKNK